MTDFRALCAELADKLDELHCNFCIPNQSALVSRALAALAEPELEPAGPTDEELEAFLLDVAAEHGDIYWAEPLVLARAVLARWGRPTAQPVL